MNAMMREILQRGLADRSPLSEVAWVVASNNPGLTPAQGRQEVLRVVGWLLESGYVVVGDLFVEPRGFRPWGLSVAETIDRIRRRWEDLDRPLDLGDVCWLQNAPEGDRRATADECGG